MKLLPAETLPEDLRWAGASEPVAQAFAALAAAVEEFGALALGPEVRARVRAELDAWNGEDPGLGRNWVEGPLAELEDKIKPDGRLALLAALAPYQVDEAAIRAFRGHDTDDERLLGGLAWASFSAARVIGRWLSEAPNQTVS